MIMHTISFLVENKAGVLFNVANLFRRRGFNIESIAVGAVEDTKYARMTIHIYADAKTLNNMVEQLRAFAAEVTRVAREVGTEGKLGRQAKVKGVPGTSR